MSRGLGEMQREILDTLDEAKRAAPRYQGGRDYGYFATRRCVFDETTDFSEPYWAERYADDTPGRVVRNGAEWMMPADVYDLRASLRYLAKRHGRCRSNINTPGAVHVNEEYRASFSRAVRRLVEDGYLVPYDRHARQRIIVRRGTPRG